MGAEFIDYVLVDDYVVPPDQQPFFTEKLVHLPGCYQVNDSRREIAVRTPSREECELPAEGFVFCSFNSSYKITPEMFGVWMRLLEAVPGSVLWLLESNRFMSRQPLPGGGGPRGGGGAAGRCPASAAGRAPRSASPGRPVPRHLPGQCPHDGQRCPVGGASRVDPGRPDLRVARGGKPAAHDRPAGVDYDVAGRL